MRLASLLTPSGPRLHKRLPEGYVDVAMATGNEGLTTMLGFLRGGVKAIEVVESIVSGGSAAEVTFGPPIDNPPKILCMGRNYRAHVEETNNQPTEWPDVFMRSNRTLAGPFDELPLPSSAVRFDYEGELGIVIGVGGKMISSERAMSHVAGYVVLNDISARDWQHRGSQWTPGKNFDRTLPAGPELVTSDEISLEGLRIETRLNGEVMQSASTDQMLLDIPGQIEFFSSFVTLEPGDLLATGTPGGVGFSRRPPVYLDTGDLIEVEIENIGTIRNVIVSEEEVGSTDAARRWLDLARSPQ